MAFYNVAPDLIDYIRSHPVTPGRHTVTARVALERRTIHVVDLQADPEYRYALRDVDPIRTELGVPMFRGDEVVGVIILYKLEVQAFTEKQIELVETFADQAVIAIENVRLFKELEARNQDLTEALEQQTRDPASDQRLSHRPSAGPGRGGEERRSLLRRRRRLDLPSRRRRPARYLQTMREVASERNTTTFFRLPIDLFSPLLKALGTPPPSKS